MPKEEKEEVFYVGVKDPIEIRRSILESSKEMVQYLQRAERFKQVRAEKEEQIASLKETMKQISTLVRKLKSSLPKTKLRAELHKHEEIVKKEEVEKVIAEAQKKAEAMPKKESAPKKQEKPTSELEKLEAELSEIESRLTKMS
jgi:hypothetical protein